MSPITTTTFTEIPKKLFADESEFYILLRPDNHISYIATEIKKIVDFLTKINQNKHD